MRAVIESRQIDEIIISTLPTTISRWLRQDLPSRVERKFSLPVTVVTAIDRPCRRLSVRPVGVAAAMMAR